MLFTRIVSFFAVSVTFGTMALAMPGPAAADVDVDQHHTSPHPDENDDVPSSYDSSNTAADYVLHDPSHNYTHAPDD